MSPVHHKTSDLGGQSPEAARFIHAQAGCIESLNRLMARHNGPVQAVVRQQVPGELPFEEALQAGRIGLWCAILGFDLTQGSAFSTYAWTCIKRHVWRAVKTHAQFEADGVACQPPELPAPAVIWEGVVVRHALPAMVARLPARLACVVIARYGLNGHTPLPYRQSCSLATLCHRLPFLWPAPDDVPPSPKQSYRSCYVYGGYEDLDDPANWKHFSEFDLVLRLIDFRSSHPFEPAPTRHRAPRGRFQSSRTDVKYKILQRRPTRNAQLS